MISRLDKMKPAAFALAFAAVFLFIEYSVALMFRWSRSTEYGEGKTAAAIDKMLDRLSTDYIDLLLLHQQFGDYLGAWKDMEKAVKAGKVKSIGISNFESERLEELCEAATVKPSVLQVECHPYYQQNALKKRIGKYGTVIESWYPIGHGDKGLIGCVVRLCFNAVTFRDRILGY